ncbi:MAG: Na+/H+ antiporter subunit G [Nitrosomonas sp.]|jgi:multicomponent K+:H+ antiporter subunit G|nr:Na+/H+ antiporter subunit G [Nitrosomonas sp.]
MLEYFLSFLILTGALLTFIGSLGLVRLKDFYTRLHGPTKATTLGVGSLLIASSIYFSMYTESVSLHEVLITLFLFITAPVSAHLLAKAALHVNLHSIAKTPENDTEAENDAVDSTEKTDSAGNMESTKSAGFETTKDNPQQAPDQIRQ